MIEARFGLKHRPFDKHIATRDLYDWPGLAELAARLEMAKAARCNVSHYFSPNVPH